MWFVGGVVMTKQEIENVIDETIKEIWVNEIADDYESGWLLKEDTLKNSFYYHLRTKMEKLFEDNDIRIFTEFTDNKFKNTEYRPDVVIAKVDLDRGSKYWGDDVTECLAVIELKYKNGFNGSKDIYSDYKKLSVYVDGLGVGCKLYMATIWEYEDDETSWEPEESEWAKGRLTELNASYKKGTKDMRFYVQEHQKL